MQWFLACEPFRFFENRFRWTVFGYGSQIKVSRGSGVWAESYATHDALKCVFCVFLEGYYFLSIQSVAVEAQGEKHSLALMLCYHLTKTKYMRWIRNINSNKTILEQNYMEEFLCDLRINLNVM